MEKLTVPGSSNLNLSFSGVHQKVLCEKYERKMCYICFIKLNAKVSSNSSREG